MTTRYRFCPAPSGWLHVGSARTALFNWLPARKDGGQFVLRIEDTDAERATLESAEGMMEALSWLGLDWDEGPAIGRFEAKGDHGPYLQSERRDLHEIVARKLLEAGHAYESFETQEELEALREEAQEENRPVTWAHRDLDDAAKQAFRDEGREAVLRVRTPDDGSITIADGVRGHVEFRWAEVPDFVIARADGSPTYMLANVVDDLSQGVGAVIRGEDLLAATPRQVLLTGHLTDGAADTASAGRSSLLDEALEEAGYPAREDGWPDRMTYAHLPLLVGEDRKKLSKRHGSVAISEFEQQGFIPSGMVNGLALCGWSYDGERERFSVPELIEAFSIERVNSSPAFFDVTKLRTINHEAVKALPDEAFVDELVAAFQRAGLVTDPPSEHDRALLAALAPHLRDRAAVMTDTIPFVAFAFADEIQFNPKAVKKWLKPAAGPVLDHVIPALEALEDWTPDAIMGVFEQAVEQLEVGMGKAMQPVRVLVTGTAISPPLPETLAALDREWVLGRLRQHRDMVPAAQG